MNNGFQHFLFLVTIDELNLLCRNTSARSRYFFIWLNLVYFLFYTKKVKSKTQSGNDFQLFLACVITTGQFIEHGYSVNDRFSGTKNPEHFFHYNDRCLYWNGLGSWSKGDPNAWMAILRCVSDNTRFLLGTLAPCNSWWRMHSQHSYPTLFPLPGCNLKSFCFSRTPTSVRSAWWRIRLTVMMAFCNTHLANTSQCPPLEQRSVLNKWGHLCELFLSLPHSKIRIGKKNN